MDTETILNDFFSQIDGMLFQNEIFDHLPDIYLFVKNIKGQFISINHNFVHLCGKNKKEEILGLRDCDLFAPHLVEGYTNDDTEVFKHQKKIVNRIELNPGYDGTVTWMETTKTPIFSKSNEVIGVFGIARDLKKTNLSLKPYQEMSKVIDYILENFTQQIPVKKLAELCHLSVSQFERNFKKNFNDSPVKYIMRLRINAACDLLIHSNDSISEIALKTGFYDHSSFTRHFMKVFSCLPKDYRKKNQVTAGKKR